MRSPRPFIVLGFATTHDALDAEALLLDLGIDVVPIPAPPAVTAGCGIALRIEPGDEPQALRYLESAGIVIGARAEIEDV